MKQKLTEQEQRVWEFILTYLEDYDCVPSYRVIASYFEWSTVNAAVYWIRKLIAKGWLTTVEPKQTAGYAIPPKTRK